jgi:tetratricopeptide (TPR) repeat protein
MRIPARLSCLLLAAVVAAQPARAGDSRPVEIPLTNGKSITGVVESAADGEVVLRLGPEEVRRIPWSRLAPLGFYRARSALAPPADGAARLQLAELAADLGLWVEARVEYEKALALGALSAAKFKANVARAERAAVEVGVQRARQLADAGDLDAALETARRLKLDFATAPNAGEINRLVADLVARVQQLDREALEAKAELERVTVELARNKEILKRKAAALDLFRNAQALLEEWRAARAQGSVSGARKLAEKADAMFQDARRHLGRLRRILPREHPERSDVLAQLTKLDGAQFELRFGMADMYAEQRSWTRAETWAALASYIDPVHPDLVELRDRLLTARIRYRVSDVTNARGRVSGP